MNKEELKELLAHVIVDMHFTEGPVSRVKSELVNKVVDVVDKWYQEPVKSVLPKDVADELEDAKKSAYNFFGFLRDCNNKTYPETCHFMFYDTVSSDTQIKILSDAWYNGYTVEQVPRYMVYVPGTNKHYLYVKRGSWVKASNKKATPITPQFINNYLATSSNHRDLYWFTDEEISKFGLQDCEKEEVTDDDE